jgi:hypothetical protein
MNTVAIVVFISLSFISFFLVYNSYKTNNDKKKDKDKTQTIENYTCDDRWTSSSYNCGGCGFNGVGGEWICCPSGSELAWGYNYCINLPRGTPCWFDSMCANGDCTSNWGGVAKGTCN